MWDCRRALCFHVWLSLPWFYVLGHSLKKWRKVKYTTVGNRIGQDADPRFYIHWLCGTGKAT